MSIWSRIVEALEALARGESFADVLEKLRAPPERSLAFTISVIGLGAKMAKADGRVTRDEVTAFREIFHIPSSEEANAARVFNLARQDVAGYETYAQRIANMFQSDPSVLENLLEGLFVIATADGIYHPAEDVFLQRVAEIFGFSDRDFRIIRSRAVVGSDPDPYDVLGADPNETLDEVRAKWRRMVRETHPDHLMAQGLPEEAIKLANRRLVAVNKAWEAILAEKAA